MPNGENGTISVLQQYFPQNHFLLQNDNLTNPTIHFLSSSQKAIFGSFAMDFPWQCLWLSWLSGHFELQRSAVRIQSSEKFILNDVYYKLHWKDKKNQNRSGMSHLKNLYLPTVSLGKFPYGKCPIRKMSHKENVL